MRPPECDVCGVEFGPSEGALVRCVSTQKDLAWRKRMDREGGVGHPPDTGWFCGAHAAGARELAGSLTLTKVVSRLRAAAPVPPPGPAPEPTPTPEPTPAEPTPAELPGPTSIGAMSVAFVRFLPTVAERVGLDPNSVSVSHDRQWHPMDGAVEPNCPFVDMTVFAARSGEVAVNLVLERAHWNEEDVARSSITLALTGAGERDFRVALASPAADAPEAIEYVAADGAVPPEIAELLPPLT